MCVEPCSVPEVGEVACRYCWQCRENRVNDWVGRCIAEQGLASATYAVTLTYAGDTPSAAVLTYRDFQNFIKRLRRDGFKVRYIVAGEYGSRKGRAHWHAILFFDDKFPRVDLDRRIDWKYWPHGFSYFQETDYHGFRYILKYLLKDVSPDSGSMSHFGMSKLPPIGWQFFADLAGRYVDSGLSPQSPEYSFREEFDQKGKRRKFWLQGRTREMFIDHYLALWRERRGGDYPFSELVELREDKIIRDKFTLTDDEFRARLLDKIIPARPVEPDAYTAEGRKCTSAYLVDPDSGIVFTRFSDGTVEIDAKECKPWLVKNHGEMTRALDALGVPRPERFKGLSTFGPPGKCHSPAPIKNTSPSRGRGTAPRSAPAKLRKL